ncbi:MAG: carbon storage regulator [Spirochaetes bacterium GWC1_27_15]|nr:MAG: carbon storage regulator [Spirochaetes bacterium GWB1_27_13]OHD25864.1 MAG: carbon storage regulator [Spirochaetes bacterium GWC1_27_15]
MLILARKENQSIMIGDNIELTIVSIKGDHVKVGINAPNDVKVFRKEIFEEIQKANIEAANVKPDVLKDIGNLFKKN